MKIVPTSLGFKIVAENPSEEDTLAMFLGRMGKSYTLLLGQNKGVTVQEVDFHQEK